MYHIYIYNDQKYEYMYVFAWRTTRKKKSKKKRKQRTHYLNEMTCAEIVLGKINRTKTDPLRFFRCSFIFTATLSF